VSQLYLLDLPYGLHRLTAEEVTRRTIEWVDRSQPLSGATSRWHRPCPPTDRVCRHIHSRGRDRDTDRPKV